MYPAIYLASASPRRRELLDQIGVSYEVLVADIDETPQPDEPADRYVVRLAEEKAQAAARRLQERGLPARPVLGADTTVLTEAGIHGKPQDRADARRMLLHLSGQPHQVLTGVALVHQGRVHTALSHSTVLFASLPADWLEDYLDSGEWMGKAGAYGIQGRAAAMAQQITGSYSGIMGLPLFETARLLLQCAKESE